MAVHRDGALPGAIEHQRRHLHGARLQVPVETVHKGHIVRIAAMLGAPLQQELAARRDEPGLGDGTRAAAKGLHGDRLHQRIARQHFSHFGHIQHRALEDRALGPGNYSAF